MLTVASVAYPLAPVGPDAVGGAEQVLSAMDRALVSAGHRSIVIACRGSVAAGELVALPPPPEVLDQAACQAAQSAAAAALATVQADLVHLHGIDFAAYLPPPGPPVLATLHLPPAWYPAAALAPARPHTWLNCVSASQHRALAVVPHDPACVLPPIGNGVECAAFGGARHARRGFALTLGRICPEKGQHDALAAAHRAGVALLIGGQVFPYAEHEAYFRTRVAPLLDGCRRFIGPVGLARKRRLLAAAQCLLVPSTAPETSSLVAMEALASGTPVIAYPSGALAGIVEPGRTGFLVEDSAAMAVAIGRAHQIDPAHCRAAAAERFGLEGMVAGYLAAYRRILAA